MQYDPPPQPLFSVVEQMQDGVDAARTANEIREQIAREIGRTAIQGTSQPK
jgi:hypothetical protein